MHRGPRRSGNPNAGGWKILQSADRKARRRVLEVRELDDYGDRRYRVSLQDPISLPLGSTP